MQSRSPSDLALVTGIIAGTVTLAAGADAAPPDWIKVTPRGAATTRDGRSFSFDPEALVSRFAADQVDLPVDTDHSTIHKGAIGEKPNTIGHAATLEARPDGTYARTSWLDSGLAVLKARTHRYVSPTFHHDASGAATWLHSIALVSAPALGGMPALAHALEGTPMKQIAKALGLAETATEAECLAALAACLKPIAGALGLADTADAQACLSAIGTLRQAGGSASLVAELQTNLAATTDRLKTLEKTNRDREVEAIIGDALKARKIVPAQRESYVLMCATDAGLAGVKAMLAATPEGLQPSGLDTVVLGGGDRDPATLAAEGRALVEERAKAGQTLSISEAITIISNRKR